MQHAITAGIATGLFGKQPLTFEQLFHGAPTDGSMAYHDTPDGQQPSGLEPLKNFPHDMTFLSPESVKVLVKASEKRGDGLWDTARAAAALGTDALVARLAQSNDLWKRYCRSQEHNQVVTIDQARVWAELEWNERILKPPGYFQMLAKRQGKDPQQAWQDILGAQRTAQVHEEMFHLSQKT